MGEGHLDPSQCAACRIVDRAIDCSYWQHLRPERGCQTREKQDGASKHKFLLARSIYCAWTVRNWRLDCRSVLHDAQACRQALQLRQTRQTLCFSKLQQPCAPEPNST